MSKGKYIHLSELERYTSLTVIAQWTLSEDEKNYLTVSSVRPVSARMPKRNLIFLSFFQTVLFKSTLVLIRIGLV